MADEQYKWLNRDAAERLLRGEPLEAVDADTRAAADRLTGALGALTAPTSDVPSVDAELPGEEAALAAFRKARAEREGEAAVLTGHDATRVTAQSADVGLVRLGRRAPEARRARWGRTVRLGLAAALTAGMLGGVAVATGTGALPAGLPVPFRDDRPEPAPSVSDAETPDRLVGSPSPEGPAGRSAGEPSPEDTPGGPADKGAKDDTAKGGDAAAKPGSQDSGNAGQSAGGGWRTSVLAACRDVRAGKDLDSGRKRGLEDAAGGKAKVKKYCDAVLSGPGDSDATGTGKGTPDDVPGGGDDGDDGAHSGPDKGTKDKGRPDWGSDGDSPGTVPGGNNPRGHGGLAVPTPRRHLPGSAPPSPICTALGATAAT